MTKKLILLLAIAAVSVVGCQETSITGSVGERQIAGAIVMSGDLEGSDPAGITIRVTGQGIEAVTGKSGAFVLNGLRDGDVEIEFVRTIDGIHASLHVEPGVDRITVSLERNNATSRRRGTRAPRIQLEGLITAISSEEITIMDSSRKMEITCTIDDDTVIRKGYRPLTTDDLAIDDRVHIRARPEANDTLVAEEVKLQKGEIDDGPPRATKKELEGPITDVSSSAITVMDASTGEQTAAITDDTVIRKGKDRLTVDDLKPGDRVHVKARVEDDESLTALEIKLQNQG